MALDDEIIRSGLGPKYAEKMEKLMNDPNEVYATQVREIYTIGQYLAQKKYRFVQFAYLSFIAGVLISSAIYVVGSYL